MIRIRCAGLRCQSLALGAVFLPPAVAATLHVPADHPTIQACIDATVSGEDECVVAPGTYHETINFLGKAITLRSSGGRDVTTIDATGIGGSVVTCTNGEGPESTLDGFTITGGTGTVVDVQAYGGGIYIGSSSPTVTNCTFTRNAAEYGGGMCNYSGSYSEVTNCTFVGNTGSYDGGGMYNRDNSSPTVSNCTFSMNTGGGMVSFYYSNPTVTNCTFNGNLGAGMSNEDNSSPWVYNCTFSENQASYGGGMSNSYSNPTVYNCNFSGNIGTSYGGGMYNHSSDTIVDNCHFSGNLSTYSGGGMYNSRSWPLVSNCSFIGNVGAFGGGMYNYDGSTPSVANCIFSGNTTPHNGGGMYNEGSAPSLNNCTFSGNTAGHLGGGMYNYRSSLRIINCILWGDSPDEIYDSAVSSPYSVAFNDVMGGYAGNGNIDAEPRFADADGSDDRFGTADDNLRFLASSPCIDAGSTNSAHWTSDLDGHARVLCGRVDMGAYEFGIGDFDCDRTVDLGDLAICGDCMRGPDVYHLATSACLAFDFDSDRDVDFSDFAGLQPIIVP